MHRAAQSLPVGAQQVCCALEERRSWSAGGLIFQKRDAPHATSQLDRASVSCIRHRPPQHAGVEIMAAEREGSNSLFGRHIPRDHSVWSYGQTKMHARMSNSRFPTKRAHSIARKRVVTLAARGSRKTPAWSSLMAMTRWRRIWRRSAEHRKVGRADPITKLQPRIRANGRKSLSAEIARLIDFYVKALLQLDNRFQRGRACRDQ